MLLIIKYFNCSWLNQIGMLPNTKMSNEVQMYNVL